MKAGSTLFLKVVLFVIGLGVATLCLFALPVGIRTDQVGYYRPILIGLYVPAIPFFIALYQAWKLLTYIDRNNAFSHASIKALKTIKYCAIIIGSLFALGLPYLFYAADLDDAPGVVLLGLVIIIATLIIATFAALLQKLIQNAVELKSENELTV